MAGFIRRFLFDPGTAELTSIEGVVVIDRSPPASISGIGSGTVIEVAEFEDGAFNTPTEVTSGEDLLRNFGGFGFEYDGIVSNNPCARTRAADGLAAENWNGNGFLALVNKRFNRLIVCRVDTSVGEVSLYRLAFVEGGTEFTWALTPGQILSFDIGGGAVDTTFDAAAATLNSAAGTFPAAPAGGEQMVVTVDAGTTREVTKTITFTSTDTTQALMITRLNEAMGFAAFADEGTDVTSLTGRVQGTAGNVQIVSINATIATALGFSAGVPTIGTGDVADISQVTLSEVQSLVDTDSGSTIAISRSPAGNIRASNPTTTAGSTIEVHPNTTAAAFGFEVGDSSSNSTGVDGTIAAGFRVRNSTGDEWVTMQSVDIEADNQGPYVVKVRPADDDGTLGSAVPGSVTTVPAQPTIGSFGVVNTFALSAALSEAALDAKYIEAIDATLNSNAISREGNIIAAARQSNAVRVRLRSNAIQASAEGLLGRMAVIRPPLNTARSVALSTTSQPGVGAYRDQRVVYAYPGAATFVPQIAVRGVGGGDGFSADGVIDTGFDSWVMSVMSQLNPEENPGQETGFLTEIIGPERGNDDVQDLRINDYKAFRAQGIAALRMDDGVAVIQSGVTSVNPATFPNLRNIARRRMADFIQDTLARSLKKFSKKLNTRDRRATMVGELRAFLESLLSRNNLASQRIAGFTLDAKSGNTPEQLAQGIFRVILKVRTLSSLDVIVLDTTVGEAVEVEEIAEAA